MLKIFFFLTTFFIATASFALEADELKTSLPNDIILGKENAPVTLIEYASLSCHHCAEFHTKILPSIQKDYIDTGKVRLIFRDFPLNEPALEGAKLAHCAGKSGGNERYFAAIKNMFAMQNEWAFAADFKAKLADLGKALSLESKTLKTCMSDKELETRILTSRQEGSQKLGVDSTPSFFINGEKAKHVHSVEAMRKLLDNALAGKSPEETAKETAKELTASHADDMMLGVDSAKVTVVEYVNIACAHCGQFHKNLLDILQKDYIDTGKVKLVFREFPMNQAAFSAYMLAHCGGNDAFFDTIALLIEETSAWVGSMAFVAPLRTVAEKAGISKDAYYACLESKEIENRILKSVSGAQALGLEHSPALYINGAAVEDANDMAAIRQIVDNALAEH